MSHHVTLAYDPSYPNSTPSNFYSVLDQTLTFNNNYEVALTEFYYPNNYNIPAFEFTIKYPNYYPAAHNSDIEHEYISNSNSYSADDEKLFLTEIISKAKKRLKQDLETLVAEFSKINIINKNCISFPETLDSAFSKYSACVDYICDIVDLYSPNSTAELLDNLFANRNSILAFLNKIKLCDNKNQKLAELMQVHEDFKDIVSNYKDPFYIEKRYTVVLQDRITSANLYDVIFRQFSGFLYTKKQSNILEVKPNITFKSDCRLIRINKSLISVNRHECISIVKNYIIYLDIIEAPIVFNKIDPIIKIVKPEGLYTDYISKSYDSAHYIKVNKNIIYKIQVQIKDQNHNLIHFNSGPIVLKLHFRKIKP